MLKLLAGIAAGYVITRVAVDIVSKTSIVKTVSDDGLKVTFKASFDSSTPPN